MKTTKCSQQVTDEALQHEHHKVRHITRGWAWTLNVVERIICEKNKTTGIKVIIEWEKRKSRTMTLCLKKLRRRVCNYRRWCLTSVCNRKARLDMNRDSPHFVLVMPPTLRNVSTKCMLKREAGVLLTRGRRAWGRFPRDILLILKTLCSRCVTTSEICTLMPVAQAHVE